MGSGSERSPGELAANLGLNRSTVSNLLKNTEADGLVHLLSDEHDGQRVSVRATPSALDLLDRFDRASARIIAEALSSFSEERLVLLAEAVPVLAQLRLAVEEVPRRR